jgi:hypothetical protein
MKLKLVAVLGLVFVSAVALANVKFFNSSGLELGHFTKVQCGTNVTCSQSSGKLNISVLAGALTGDLTGDGGDQLHGFLQNRVTASTTALTAAQCGSTVVSAAAAVQPLPEASTVLGCRYTFICGTADDFDIDPADGTDAISVVNSVAAGTGAAITPSAGDEIRCTDIGSSVVLEAVGNDLWAAVGVANGAWTDVN